MKRLLRIIRSIALLLSLLLCIICAILWVRSYYVGDMLWYFRNGYDAQGTQIRRHWGVQCVSGQLIATHGFTSALLADQLRDANQKGLHLGHRIPERIDPSSGFVVWSRFGFMYALVDQPSTYISALVIPVWVVILAFMAGPLIWLILRLRRRGRSPTACPTCGYDLRATPDRCPECGSAPPQLTMHP